MEMQIAFDLRGLLLIVIMMPDIAIHPTMLIFRLFCTSSLVSNIPRHRGK